MNSQGKVGARHKEFRIYSKSIGKLLVGFKQGEDFINVLFKDHSGCSVENGLHKDKTIRRQVRKWLLSPTLKDCGGLDHHFGSRDGEKQMCVEFILRIEIT